MIPIQCDLCIMFTYNQLTHVKIEDVKHGSIKHFFYQHFLLDTAQNALQREWGNFPSANWNGICWGLPLQLVQLIKIIFCHIWNLLCENRNLKRNFSKKGLYNPLMVCFLFSNYHFQMGVTVMGFAEHFGLYYFVLQGQGVLL